MCLYARNWLKIERNISERDESAEAKTRTLSYVCEYKGGRGDAHQKEREVSVYCGCLPYAPTRQFLLQRAPVVGIRYSACYFGGN